MRLIDADSLKEKFHDPVTLAFVKEMIDAEPEAIVKCKECKYGEDDSTGVLYCKGIGYQVGKEDFCNYGERKDT